MNAKNLKKEIQNLNGMLTALNKFILKFKHALSFYMLLRRKAEIEWTPECKKAFESLKDL